MKLHKKIFEFCFICLGLTSFAIGMWFFRDFMINFDERDHLAAGFLMSKGWVLYKDIFSHHFPLPYYWVNALGFLWTSETGYRGVVMFRTTLTLFYLLLSTITLINLKNFKQRAIFIIFLLSILLLVPIFHGNVLLSETFGFFPVILVIWLGLMSFSGTLNDNQLLAASSAILCAAAFWTQPLLIVSYIIPLFYIRKNLIKYVFFSFITLVAPLIGFLINGSFSNFWEMGILFNYSVYPKFSSMTNTGGIQNGFFGQALGMISNQLKFHTFNPNNPVLLSQLVGSLLIDFYIIWLLFKRKWKYLLFFVVSFLTVRIREVKIIPGELFNFGVFPYMLLINATFIISITYFRRFLKIFFIFAFFGYLLFTYKAAEPIIKQSLVKGYNYHVFWSDRQSIGDEIARSSNSSDPILVYPFDVDLYYFSKRTPPDMFLYWFPWINSVNKYKETRDTSIKNKSAQIIYLGVMSDKDRAYYMNIWPDMAQGYNQATTEGKYKDIWIKP